MKKLVVWDPRHEWRTGGFGFWGSGIRGTCEPRHRMFQFPDREIPERNGSVDSLTIGIRDSGFSCACELCSREPRTPEARVHRFFRIRHFADLGDKRSGTLHIAKSRREIPTVCLLGHVAAIIETGKARSTLSQGVWSH
jgi:hypothetical protein